MNQVSTRPDSNTGQDEELEQMPVMQHLITLRKYLFKIVGITLLLFFCLLPFRNTTYQLLSEPLRQQLPVNSTMIATDVTATFMAPFKLNLFVALVLAMPVIIYLIWSFVRPALYEKERFLAVPLLVGSIALFYIGIAFAYFITLPAILHFFISVSPESVAPMTDINSYLSFCLKLFLHFFSFFLVEFLFFDITQIDSYASCSSSQQRNSFSLKCIFKMRCKRNKNDIMFLSCYFEADFI